jgi:hypothetical protein
VQSGAQAEAVIRRNEHVMTTADSPTGANFSGRKIDYAQFRTWIVAQSVRNALGAFHGRCAFDPDNPDSEQGFISDNQMRVLNITIRRAVHEALCQVDLALNAMKRSRHRALPAERQQALDFCKFQLSTVHDYMESPGSPELEEAYLRYVSQPDVNR